MGKVYRCELCKTADGDFTTPVDPIGAAIMKQHLQDVHNADTYLTEQVVRTIERRTT